MKKERLEKKYQEVLESRNQVAVEKVEQILDIFRYSTPEGEKIKEVVMLAVDEEAFAVAVAVEVLCDLNYDEAYCYFCHHESFSKELQEALNQANKPIGEDDKKRVRKLLTGYCKVEKTAKKIDGYTGSTVKVVLKED